MRERDPTARRLLDQVLRLEGQPWPTVRSMYSATLIALADRCATKSGKAEVYRWAMRHIGGVLVERGARRRECLTDALHEAVALAPSILLQAVGRDVGRRLQLDESAVGHDALLGEQPPHEAEALPLGDLVVRLEVGDEHGEVLRGDPEPAPRVGGLRVGEVALAVDVARTDGGRAGGGAARRGTVGDRAAAGRVRRWPGGVGGGDGAAELLEIVGGGCRR